MQFRFTEEAFAALISIVFIIQSFEKLVEISHDAPIIVDPKVHFNYFTLEEILLSLEFIIYPKLFKLKMLCHRTPI